jgi:alkanesulfonate monooxygenase SsuD/methylene tetrahydromethanopterin reductase-like flavin-dependent oxidoreductase (luciferase family)
MSQPHPQRRKSRAADDDDVGDQSAMRGGGGPMKFGVVLQTNPPAWRTVQLAELAEAHGFDYVWTFDSHLLWQEPYVIYSQILSRTNRVIVGRW